MIDKNTLEQARSTDLITFLERYAGLTFTQKGGAYRCSQHPSLAVKNDRLSFYWHSKGVGGHGVLDYLTKAENMTFREAVETVTGTATIAAPPQERPTTPPQKKLILPDKKGIPLRLYEDICCKGRMSNSSNTVKAAGSSVAV